MFIFICCVLAILFYVLPILEKSKKAQMPYKDKSTYDPPPQAKEIAEPPRRMRGTIALRNLSGLSTETIRRMKEGYFAIDLETTGLDAKTDRIAEVGLIFYQNGVEKYRYETLIDPGIPMPPRAYAVNHISDDMLETAPKEFEEYPVLADLLADAWTGKVILCAHNAPFDMAFLSEGLMRYGYSGELSYVDTLSVSKRLLEGLSSFKLSSVADYLSIQNQQAHRAASDAEVCGKIMWELLQRQERKNLEAPQSDWIEEKDDFPSEKREKEFFYSFPQTDERGLGVTSNAKANVFGVTGIYDGYPAQDAIFKLEDYERVYLKEAGEDAFVYTWEGRRIGTATPSQKSAELLKKGNTVLARVEDNGINEVGIKWLSIRIVSYGKEAKGATTLSNEEQETCDYIQGIIAQRNGQSDGLRFYKDKNGYIHADHCSTFLRFKFGKRGSYLIVRAGECEGKIADTAPCSKAEGGSKYERVFFKSPSDLEPFSDYIWIAYKEEQ